MTTTGRTGIRLILLAFAVLGGLWAVRIPLPGLAPNLAGNFNPDETNHLNVISYMATRHGLPPYTPRYQVSQSPPLYHGLMALVFGNAVTPLGFDHTVLLLRLLSVPMGLGTIWLTYLTALRMLSPSGALLAAGCVAGVPMFVSLSAAVNIDNLATLAATGALATLTAGVIGGFSARRLWTLAIWTAVGISSKVTCLALFPAILAAFWWDWRRTGRRWQVPARQLALIFVVCLVVIGWWYGRNILLYGDPFRAEAHKRMWAQNELSLADYRRAGVSLPHWLLKVFVTSAESFWGIFNGMMLQLPRYQYVVLFTVTLLSFAGLARLSARGRLHGDHAAAAGVLAVFCVSLLTIYLAANVMTYTPQGRYLFLALLPFGLATAAGWRALFPARLRDSAGISLLLGLGALNVFCLVYVPSHL